MDDHLAPQIALIHRVQFIGKATQRSRQRARQRRTYLRSVASAHSHAALTAASHAHPHAAARRSVLPALRKGDRLPVGVQHPDSRIQIQVHVAKQIAERRSGRRVLLESCDFFCQFAAFLRQVLLLFAQHPVANEQGGAPEDGDQHDSDDQHERGDQFGLERPFLHEEDSFGELTSNR